MAARAKAASVCVWVWVWVCVPEMICVLIFPALNEGKSRSSVGLTDTQVPVSYASAYVSIRQHTSILASGYNAYIYNI